MNEVEKQVAELQAKKENKKEQYSVEIENEDVASPAEEKEIELPQKESTFEAEVTEETPAVEEQPKQQEEKLKQKKNLKRIQNKNIVSHVQKRFDEYAYQLRRVSKKRRRSN